MSDYNSSLPIRTENNGDAAVKIVDGTITSQQLAVNADGSLNITDNAGSITVDATNLDIRDLAFATDKVDVTGSDITATVTATDLDIRDLVFATDKVDASGSEVSLDAATLAALESITVQNGAGGAAVNIQDGGNSITVDGTVELGATTLAALESITVQNGAGAGAVNIQDGGNSITVDATDLDIRDLTHVSDSVKVGDGTDLLAINTDGSINVVIVDASPGTAINDYTTATVAAAGNSVHTYTSVGNFYLTQIHASASGKMKIVIAVNAVTKFVCFNSTASPNMDIKIDNPLLATTGQTVTITRTNLDNQSMDVYSTISGYNA